MTRPVGRRNNRTLEQFEIAERKFIEHQRGGGRKLAKDELEDLAYIAKSAAAYHQPTIVTKEMEEAAKASGQPIRINPHGDWGEFARWYILARDTFEAYAKYQSATFKAVTVSTPTSEREGLGTYASRQRLEAKIMKRILAEEIELEAEEIARTTESPSRKNVA